MWIIIPLFFLIFPFNISLFTSVSLEFLLTCSSMFFASSCIFFACSDNFSSRVVGSLFFNCYLTAPQPTFGHSWGESLTDPMLIIAFSTIVTRRLPGASQRGWVAKASQTFNGVWTRNFLILNTIVWLEILLALLVYLLFLFWC